jgi:HEAT repeat protein
MPSDRGHVRLPAARSRRCVPAVLLVLLSSVPALWGQGTRAQPFTRGRPLAEWVAQSQHYIPELRREAVKAIAALGPGAVSAVPALVRATRDENAEVRFWAIEGLRKIGPPARESGAALTVVLADDIRPNQEAARRALEAIGPGVLPVVLPALSSPDAWVRGNAAEVVGAIGGGRKQAVAGLTRLLTDDSLWVRASAAWAIGRLGPGAKQAAKPMIRALGEELRRDPTLSDPGQRLRVENLVYALGRLKAAGSDAVPLVVSVFYDGGDSLRRVATEALAGIGSKAAPPLAAAVRSGTTMPARLEAARGLRLMGSEGKKAVKDLVKVLETTDELEGGHDLVIATADALGAMGKAAKGALRVLERHRKRSVTPDVVAALDRSIRKIRLGG